MNMPQLTPTEIAIIVIALVALVAIALIVRAFNRRRTQQLRAKFGPEYDRTVALVGRQSVAEDRLVARSERVHKLVIRSLNSVERARYIDGWGRVQAHFVDAPAGAVTEADQLLGDVMAACGYPIGDFEQRAADISVDHPVVTQNYRAAHDIALRRSSGRATTEELRRAMIHYRALFEELVGVPDGLNSRPIEVLEERNDRADIQHRRAS
jgi:hypothetical protein